MFVFNVSDVISQGEDDIAARDSQNTRAFLVTITVIFGCISSVIGSIVYILAL